MRIVADAVHAALHQFDAADSMGRSGATAPAGALPEARREAAHPACDGLWVHELRAAAGPLELLALSLLRGLADLVLDPTPPRQVVLATGQARSDAAEFGACTSSFHVRWIKIRLLRWLNTSPEFRSNA